MSLDTFPPEWVTRINDDLRLAIAAVTQANLGVTRAQGTLTFAQREVKRSQAALQRAEAAQRLVATRQKIVLAHNRLMSIAETPQQDIHAQTLSRLAGALIVGGGADVAVARWLNGEYDLATPAIPLFEGLLGIGQMTLPYGTWEERDSIGTVLIGNQRNNLLVRALMISKTVPFNKDVPTQYTGSNILMRIPQDFDPLQDRGSLQRVQATSYNFHMVDDRLVLRGPIDGEAHDEVTNNAYRLFAAHPLLTESTK